MSFLGYSRPLGFRAPWNPEIAKQQHLSEGDSYMAGKKYTEVILSYRNAVRQDERFGEARLTLAEAYLATGDGQNALRASVVD